MHDDIIEQIVTTCI